MSLKVYFSRRIRDFTSDWVQWGSVLFVAVIFCFHVFQFIDSSFRIEPLIRVVFGPLYIVTVFIAGKRAVPYLFLILAYEIMQFNEFNNYTAFWAVCLFCCVKPKMTVPVLALYVIDVFIVCQRHDKTASHLFIHFGCCILFYVISNIVVKNYIIRQNRVKKLIFKKGDREILDYVAVKGYRQKEVPGYDESTVSKKISACVKRNGFKSKQELFAAYSSSCS